MTQSTALLKPEALGDNPGNAWLFVVYRRYICVVCHHERRNYSKVNKANEIQEAVPIKDGKYPDWDKALRTLLVQSLDNDKDYLQKRGKVHTGLQTSIMAGDTAKVYKDILRAVDDAQKTREAWIRKTDRLFR